MSGTTPSGRSPASVRMVKPGSHGIVSISGSNFRIAIWIGSLGQLREKYIWRGLKVLREKARFGGLDRLESQKLESQRMQRTASQRSQRRPLKLRESQGKARELEKRKCVGKSRSFASLRMTSL